MTMTILVNASHAAKLGYCTGGQDTLLRRYNIDPLRFYGKGVPVAELQHINNALIRNVVAQAVKDHQEGDING